MKIAIMSGLEVGDEVFENDHGRWNVTKAKMHCAAGLHQKYLFDTEPCYQASKCIETERKKLEALEPWNLLEPLIFVILGGKLYLIDGRHRLELLHLAGIRTFVGFVIEEEHEPKYRVKLIGGDLE